ncbi:MAG: rhomboid family intramembrane serine protease [Bacteroidales bacterium]|jgi:membrane associated rhomboid family serine protease|nr:rhomboid family intramembrane serine protease [Bacteroidales bacterium]
MNTFGRGFSGMPPVVKNLILINVIMLLAMYTAGGVFGIDLNSTLGLYFPKSDHFRPYQVISHMFMHGGIGHLFFNMFALFMFGRVLESVWGPKRFFIYYFVSGLGAALTHEVVMAIQYANLAGSVSPEQLQMVLERGSEILRSGRNFTDPDMGQLNRLLNTPTVGASGAVFGILLAFGMLFPNTQLMLLFPPIPIKAKWFVIGYGAIELYFAISQPGSNIAHAAHLGGMIFGYILIKIWKKTTNTLY